MSQLNPHQYYLHNLEGRVAKGGVLYLEPETAYAELKEITGQDFGFDTGKWEEWLLHHRDEFYDRHKMYKVKDLRDRQ